MTVIKFLLVLFYVFACGVLIFVVLLQQGRGATMGATLGGGASETLFGSRTSSFITRFTALMAGAYMVLAMVLAKYPPFGTDTSSDVRDILTPEEVQEAPAAAAAPEFEEPLAPAETEGAAPQAVDESMPGTPGDVANEPAPPAEPTPAEAEVDESVDAPTVDAQPAEAAQPEDAEAAPAAP